MVRAKEPTDKPAKREPAAPKQREKESDAGSLQLSLLSTLEKRTGAMTVKELATLLSVSVRTIYNMIEKDGFPVIRIGASMRIDPVQAAKWLRDRRVHY